MPTPRTAALNPPTPKHDTPDARIATWTKRLALYTLLLTLFTLALVVTSIFGVIATNRQSDVAERAEKYAVVQNKISALAQQDTREQLRAVMALTGFANFPAFDPVEKEPVFTLVARFQNFGGARTGRFSAWSNIHYFEKEVPDGVDLNKPYTKMNIGNVLVGPGAPSFISSSFLKKDADKVLLKQGVLVLWGKADYSDIFSPDVNHEIGFCYSLSVAMSGDSYVFNNVPVRDDCNYSR